MYEGDFMKFTRLRKTICASLAALMLGSTPSNTISANIGANCAAISFLSGVGSVALVSKSLKKNNTVAFFCALALGALSLGTGVLTTGIAGYELLHGET